MHDWLFWLILVLTGAGPLYAQETPQNVGAEKDKARFELEEVVVTATMLAEPVKRMPRNVTVITSDDIGQASSNNVVDLLAREANVSLQSFYGHDKNANVDIRGQGINASSNVIVMVDGFRLNPPDLSGPDFSSIPLDQIERIEVLRGAGSVLYGDGAVGGVINIITKKGIKREVRLSGAYGSYETIDLRASTGGQVKDLGYNLSGDYHDTEGYRDNGFYQRKDVRARMGYDLLETMNLSLAASCHEDDQGFPGPVPLEDINDEVKRKKTRAPNDSGETTDWRFTGNLDTNLRTWGLLALRGGYRIRQNDFVFGYTPLKSKEEQKGQINEDTIDLTAKYTIDYDLFERNHTFQIGLDTYYTDYISERPDQRIRKNSLVKDVGLYFMNQSPLRDDLMLRFGYRFNTHDGTFRNDVLRTFGGVDRWVNGTEFDRNWDNNAVDVGLVYSPTSATTLFTSYATTFRVPNVDELALAVGDLAPQKGKHIDIGVRHKIKGIAELSLTLFQIDIEDEIFFDAANNVNRNFEDKTRRRGVEVDFKLYPFESIYVWGNYTHMEAKFERTDTVVPLVPENTASIGLEWRILKTLVLAFTGTYVGSKFDGNDLSNNRFAKIDSYAVVDGKLTYAWKDLKVFFSVNNIFDEFYETLAFSESYFTMPTRNYYGGVQWKF